jgi:hypothetical protein
MPARDTDRRGNGFWQRGRAPRGSCGRCSWSADRARDTAGVSWATFAAMRRVAAPSHGYRFRNGSGT